MPIIPTGGLSIFLNLTILMVGFLVKSLKKNNFKTNWLNAFFGIFTEKRFNTLTRQIFGYGICTTICILMMYTTGFSLYQRLNSDSNFDVFFETMALIDVHIKPLFVENVNKTVLVTSLDESLVVPTVGDQPISTPKFAVIDNIDYATGQLIAPKYTLNTSTFAVKY